MPQSLDDRIHCLVPRIDAAIRDDLRRILATVRSPEPYPEAGIVMLSRVALAVFQLIFQARGEKLPSENLFAVIARATKGDAATKVVGLQFLPDEVATGLHPLRIFANKVRHRLDVELSVEEAELSLNALLILLRWFHCDSGLVDKLPSIYGAPSEQRRREWDAQAVMLQQTATDDVDRLREAGWRIEEHPRFTGREFVFAAFDEFAASCRGHGGIFLVRAPAGMGKTALVTEWIRRTGHDRAGFYFRYRDGRVSTEAMAETLWTQLGNRYQLAEVAVPPPHAYVAKLEERLREIAAKLGEKGQLLLFVDALDEATEPEKAVQLLPKHLPEGVFVVVTSRSTPELHNNRRRR